MNAVTGSSFLRKTCGHNSKRNFAMWGKTKAAVATGQRRFGQPLPVSHPYLLKEGELTPGLTKDEYRNRREKLIQMLPDNSIFLQYSATTQYMTNDIPWPFRQHNDFLYLTGFQEPDSILILSKMANRGHFHLLVRPRDAHKELWDGPRAGVAGALQHFGPDAADELDELPRVLAKLLKDAKAVYMPKGPPPPSFPHQPLSIMQGVNKSVVTRNGTALVERLRLFKSPAEADIMRAAGALSGDAYREVMAQTRSDMREAQLEALMEHYCKMRGATRLAYPPVVANGINNNTIHYILNDERLDDGNLVLMDAGCELHGYNADITRSWPVSGRFSPGQRDLYQLVLQVQKQCVEMCSKRPFCLMDLHHFSYAKMHEMLSKIGLLSQEIDLRTLYPHSIGHYLGMDVHDTGSVSDREPFQPGMVVTVEPGIYVPDHPNVPEKYRGIGIRIEDDVLIREDGRFEVLTARAPKEIDEIEEVMRKRT